MSYRKKVQLYQCDICRTESDNKSFFDVHHIDENHDNNMEYNLLTVCPSCHRKCHLKEFKNIRWLTTTDGRKLFFD